ncbi:MAG TPA: UPF0758 domain-containing protein, partial [Puia sp.]|nr:UPF0758 domain-containing protein [Puia sp.]
MQAEKYPIRKWAKDDRPREKLLSKSPHSLSNSELLAILIGSGTPEKSALELGKEILKLGDDDLNKLGKLSPHEMEKIRGIGPARAAALAAALELGRRRQVAMPSARFVIKDSRSVAAYCQSRLRDHHYEVLAIILLNRGGRINHFEEISQGGITATVADPRLIV